MPEPTVQPGAPQPRSIWLIGLMGSGKSTLGRVVAGRLDVPFVDNDATIADMAGVSTVELSRGPAGLLHTWESRYVDALVTRSQHESLVAGIAASSADRDHDLTELTTHGVLVYLRCDVPTLVARVRRDPERPYLDGDVEATLTGMFERRDPVLRSRAQLVLDGTADVAELTDLVLTQLPT